MYSRAQPNRMYVFLFQLFDVDKDVDLEESEWNLAQTLCIERRKHLPIQYVLGEWDFLNLTLRMKRPVFIPRPETEVCFNGCMFSPDLIV